MIYSVTGTVVDFDRSMVAVETGGIAFQCLTSFATAQKCASVGSKVTLLTYLNVREDSVELFGFHDKAELQCFKMLITVNGVGPKMALAILSELPADKVALSIAAGDYKALTKTPGVGAKMAQRIVMELKDKIGSALGTVDNAQMLSAVSSVSEEPSASEAVAALEMLGYSQSEASVAVSRLDSSLPVEEIIKRALRQLSSKV